MRRLPIYLLFDNSESMKGEPFLALENGLSMFVNALRGEPQALETAYLSVITFSDVAIQHNQLSDLLSFQKPLLLSYGKKCSFGAALELLSFSIDKEVEPINDKNGDWKPIVIVFISSTPTDGWQKALAEIRQRAGTIIVLIAGNEVNPSIFNQLPNYILDIASVSKIEIYNFYSSIRVDKESNATILHPPPPDLYIKDENSTSSMKIHSLSSRSIKRQPIYIMVDVSSEQDIDLMENGIQTIVDALRGEPQMLETAYLSLINFGYSLKQEISLTELSDFQIPYISECFDFNAALNLLCEKMDSETLCRTLTEKGDWEQYVFILISDKSMQKINQKTISNLKNSEATIIFFVHEISDFNKKHLENSIYEIELNRKYFYPKHEICKLNMLTKDLIRDCFQWTS